MMPHTPKPNNSLQLKQDLDQQWQHALAERQLEVQIADLEDQLLMLRHIREWRWSVT